MSTPNNAPIDFSPLYDVAGGEEAIVLSLLTTISKSLAKQTPLMREAFEEGRPEELQQHAHKLKSSVAYLYFSPLEEALDRIEASEEDGLNEEQIAEAYERAMRLSEQAKSVVDIKISMMHRKPFGSEEPD